MRVTAGEKKGGETTVSQWRGRKKGPNAKKWEKRDVAPAFSDGRKVRGGARNSRMP